MTRKTDSPAAAGQYAYEGLDRLLHEKARLGILTSLLTHPEGLRFNELKELCSLTDGNLSRHLQILAAARLVEIWKGYDRKRPQTLCRLSALGRKRFLSYLAELESVLTHAAAELRRPAPAAAASPDRTVAPALPPDWVPA